MKNLRLFSLFALALVISLALTSAYTPLLANGNYDRYNNDDNDNVYLGIPALACDVGYYGYNCKNSGNSNQYSDTNNYYNSYNYDDYYYNNYNYQTNYYNTNYQRNNYQKYDYKVYNQADKLYYPYTYDIKQYRVYDSDYQVRYVRANPDRCATRDYTYPCDFYYGEIH